MKQPIDDKVAQQNDEFYKKPFKVDLKVHEINESSRFGLVQRRKFIVLHYYGDEDKPVVKERLAGVQKKVGNGFKWTNGPRSEYAEILKEKKYL